MKKFVILISFVTLYIGANAQVDSIALRKAYNLAYHATIMADSGTYFSIKADSLEERAYDFKLMADYSEAKRLYLLCQNTLKKAIAYKRMAIKEIIEANRIVATLIAQKEYRNL